MEERLLIPDNDNNPIPVIFDELTIEQMKVKKESHVKEQQRLLDLIEKESFSCYLLAQQLRMACFMDSHVTTQMIIKKM